MLPISKNIINFANSVLKNQDEGCNHNLSYVDILSFLHAIVPQELRFHVLHSKNESEMYSELRCLCDPLFAVEDKDKW